MMDSVVKEELFHDTWADNINVDEILVDELGTACSCPETRMIFNSLGDISNKKILELGCGAGEASVYFAKQGALCTASDLSSGMLGVVKRLATKHGVEVKTLKCSSESTLLPNACMDVVYAANLLHHVDIEMTLRETMRVLKPGGIFVTWDPLKYNPIINVYRRIASSVRTDDEHPLSISDVSLFKKYFKYVRVSASWFLTLSIFLKYYFIDRVNPNKERYWKKVVAEYSIVEPVYTPLEKIDTMLLKRLPFIKWLYWNVVVFARK